MESFVKDCLKNWTWFVGAALAGMLLFAGIHMIGNQIEVETLLIANSRMGEKISQEGSDKGSVDIRTKRDLKDLVLWLKTYDFMDQFLKQNCSPEKSASFCAPYSAAKEAGPLKLIKALSTRVEDDRVLVLKVGAQNAQMASDLANTLSQALIDFHEQQTQMDVKKFEQNLAHKRAEIEDRLHNSLQTLSNTTDVMPSFQTSPEKQYSYLTDLQIKASELDLKIAENERTIKVLREQVKNNPNADYGPALDIQKLKTDNKLLAGNKKSIEAQIKKAVNQQYGKNPHATSLTRLQEQFRVDLETYSSLTRASEKIKLLASVPNMNLEVFQKASPVLARNRWPMSLMLGLGLFLSQLIAVTAMLLIKMWRQDSDRIWQEEIGRELRRRTSGVQVKTTEARLRHGEYYKRSDVESR